VIGSESDSQYTFETNITGTWNVVRAAAQAGVAHLVFASSREVYGEPNVLPVSEQAPIQPRNIYGASKAAGELVLLNSPLRPPAVSILRLANVIGPGDSGRVIPIWLAAAHAGTDLELFGGDQELDLVPIEFVTSVFARVIETGRLEEPLNVGSGTTTRLCDLANHIIFVTRSRSTVKILPRRGPEVTRFRANIDRLRSVLGLNPPQQPMLAIGPDW
jgi:nucleoside-diphosphate-sugar epimerase